MRLQQDVRTGIKGRCPPIPALPWPSICPSFADSCHQHRNNCAPDGYDGISHQRIRNYPCQTTRGAAADEDGGYW